MRQGHSQKQPCLFYYPAKKEGNYKNENDIKHGKRAFRPYPANMQDGKYKANTWQGFFPIHNSKEDGYRGIAPVGCFDANNYGVYDLIGNVWEWTGNWYAPRHNPEDSTNPQGPEEGASFDKNNAGFPVRVIKGGSYLCAPNFCMRYRPAARHAQDSGLGTTHIGFRTVLNKQ